MKRASPPVLVPPNSVNPLCVSDNGGVARCAILYEKRLPAAGNGGVGSRAGALKFS